jgi:predicted NBD/HSP70 family sugar kinase
MPIFNKLCAHFLSFKKCKLYNKLAIGSSYGGHKGIYCVYTGSTVLFAELLAGASEPPPPPPPNMLARIVPMVATMLEATGKRAAAVGMSIWDRAFTRL